ncbi:MAG: hypothetical protein IPM68_13995 [Flavobacteriales bacterium]|nr:hypothetical protein [Flavobacteriales bacterium]
MLAGVYTYTVTGAAPCPSESANVTVVVNTPPDPGTDGSITLCSTDAPADLFTLLGGTPDAGGAWSGPSTLTGSSFDPGSMLAGVYTYTVTGAAPCPSESANVTVVVNTPPDPGTDGSITFAPRRGTDAPADLFTLLGGTPDTGGAWSGPSTLTGSSFDPGSMLAGVYTYTVTGAAPCPSESANVTVVVNTPPDPAPTAASPLRHRRTRRSLPHSSAARPIPVVHGAARARSPAAASTRVACSQPSNPTRRPVPRRVRTRVRT